LQPQEVLEDPKEPWKKFAFSFIGCALLKK